MKRRRREMSCVSAGMDGPQAVADGPASAVVAPLDAAQAEAGGDHHGREDLAPAIVRSASSDTGTAAVTVVSGANASRNSEVGPCDAVAAAAATRKQLGDLLKKGATRKLWWELQCLSVAPGRSGASVF